MLRSMFAAISALRNHQTFMDVVSNNIANINTPGFKSSRVSFASALEQTIRGASAPEAGVGRGSINPMQIGLGMTLRGIEMVMSQGDFQPTGKVTDLAVEGDGFFLVSDGQKTTYTRDGSFELSANGTLLNPSSGLKLQGWSQTDATGNIPATGTPGDVVLPLDRTIGGTPTGNVAVAGNLSAGAAALDVVSVQVPIYDTLGSRHQITATMTKTDQPRQWSIAVTGDVNDPLLAGATIGAPNPALVTFSANGLPDALSFVANVALPAGGPTVGAADPASPTGPRTGNITFDLSKLSQVSGDSALNVTSQDGHQSGSLVNFNIGATGQVVGIFSNGTNQVMAQVALARFSNPSGLSKGGGNTFDVTSASGQPILGAAGSGGRGTIASGVLEMSNVNLAQQFTNMIVAERGFQANARLITTSDEMLQDLINLKR